MTHDYISYSRGCRCETCREAWRLRARAYDGRRRGRRVTVGAGPSGELARCLLAFGISQRRLAKAMGRSSGYVHLLVGGRIERVARETVDAVRKLHWGAFMSSGEFRRHCVCEMPIWVENELRKEAV